MIIHNCKTHRPDPNNPLHIYCGRACSGLPASPLANPFKISPSQDRAAVIAQYKQNLWHAMNGKKNALHPDAFSELKRLALIAQSGIPISLFCWCHPLPCHCEIISAAIQFLNR